MKLSISLIDENFSIYRKNVEEYFGELLPHAANGNTKKKKNIEEYFGSEIDFDFDHGLDFDCDIDFEELSDPWIAKIVEHEKALQAEA